MPCYFPQIAYRSRAGRNPNGSWPVVFDVSKGYKDLEVILPCGKCIGCKLEKSRQWAIRCVLESKTHDENCFVTLTINEYHIEEMYSLDKKVVQDFIKRLRKEVDRKYNKKIRYYVCGEYGELSNRAHYHMAIFGFDFPDKEVYKMVNNVALYRSPLLEEKWKFGYSTIGQLTWESAAYIARYITKKITGDLAEQHYDGLTPEFALMSRNIGKEWMVKNANDIEKVDRIILRNNLTMLPPKMYNDMVKRANPDLYKILKSERRKRIKNYTFERRNAKREFAEICLKNKNRRYENGTSGLYVEGSKI